MIPAANIPEINVPSKAVFDIEIRPAIKPVIMRGLVKDWPAVQMAKSGGGSMINFSSAAGLKAE